MGEASTGYRLEIRQRAFLGRPWRDEMGIAKSGALNQGAGVPGGALRSFEDSCREMSEKLLYFGGGTTTVY